MFTMKRNLVLASLFLFGLVVAVVPAQAQVAFQLSTLQRTVRVEGTTEAVGSVILAVTTGGNITANSTLSIAYGSGATATNIMAGTGSYSVNGAAATLCSAGVVAPVTACAVSGNSITLTIDNSAWVVGNSIVISGVRVNANAAGVGATISATATATVPAGGFAIGFFITNTGPVASVATATTVVVTAGGGILTCVASDTGTYTVKITENNNQAFSSLTDEANYGGAPGGTVDSLFTITFANVPVGVTISLTDFTGSTASVTGLLQLSATETGGTSVAAGPITFDGTVASPGVTAGGPVSATSKSGSQTLVFTIDVTQTATTGSNEVILATFDASTAGTIALGSATVNAAVALTSAATATQAPQFTTNTQATGGPVFGVSDCVTNLLFPWIVVDAPGGTYDTGMAIANTTADVFASTGGGAAAQSGTCTLTGFSMTDGSTVSTTTPTIVSGGTGAMVLSSVPAFAGFRGYVIAVCNFQDAHGFAFITQDNATPIGTSQGYLGLVIPNPALSSRVAANGGKGESLGN
jgi:hypothetical protein